MLEIEQFLQNVRHGSYFPQNFVLYSMLISVRPKIQLIFPLYHFFTPNYAVSFGVIFDRIAQSLNFTMLLTKTPSRRREPLPSSLSANTRISDRSHIIRILVIGPFLSAHPALRKSNDADPPTYFSPLWSCYRIGTCRKEFFLHQYIFKISGKKTLIIIIKVLKILNIEKNLCI